MLTDIKSHYSKLELKHMIVSIKNLLRRKAFSTVPLQLVTKKNEAVYGVFREDLPAKLGETREFISIANVDSPDSFNVEETGKSSLWEVFVDTVTKNPDKNFLGTRNGQKEGAPYEWVSFK